MQIVIAGLGLMGGSMALAIKQNLPQLKILGYDLPHVAEEALQRNIIDGIITDWPRQCRDADLIFLATPLRILKQHLTDLNGVVSKSTLVTDMGSTKQQLQELVERLAFSGTYVGGHPMTGAEKSGLNAANALLFENAVYILTNTESCDPELLEQKLLFILKAIKSRVLFLDPGIHDKILAAISHLPQILAIDLVNLVGDRDSEEYPYLQLAAGGFRDLTRIASSSIDIWQDIFQSNRENVRQVIRELIKILQNNLEKLDNLAEDFNKANQYRQRVPKAGKGFMAPLTDVMVYVTDQVGVIAKIANALSRHKIDIRDIELLKIREKEGGVFRLSFANLDEAQTAVTVLEEIGYQAAIRE